METTTTELAYRRDGNTEVALHWDRLTGKLTVSVIDVASGDAFRLPVAPQQALDSFYHPYAYAASMGVEYSVGAEYALNA